MSHPPNWPASATEQSPRDELGWSAPQRSMSYGNVEGLPHHPSYPGYPQPPASQSTGREEFTPRQIPQQHENYVPPLSSTSSGAQTAAVSSTDQTTHPPPAPPPPYPVTQNWQQQYGYPKPPLSAGSDGYTGWYGQGSTLPSHPHPSGSEVMPATGYGHSEPYSGMYYNTASQGGRQ